MANLWLDSRTYSMPTKYNAREKLWLVFTLYLDQSKEYLLVSNSLPIHRRILSLPQLMTDTQFLKK